MREQKPVSGNATVEMAEALARWERDGGAHAKVTTGRTADWPVPTDAESILADVATRQGMLLERSDENGAANYRLVLQDDAPRPSMDPASFKLTLDDVETILMSRSPA
jgi:hypothetical protein